MTNAPGGRFKQVVLLSGKGGTGKTSLSAAFAHLAGETWKDIPPVFVDADVDAANLSLVLNPEPAEAHDFWGGSLAVIDSVSCAACGECQTVCRYDAIIQEETPYRAFRVDAIACDGCAACVYVCPQGAISMEVQQEGQWFHSVTPYGHLFHAELFPGRENSGKLVTLIRQQARLWAEDMGAAAAFVDGPPGIGCPVISACAGMDLGVIVAEPGLAGIHDMKRVLGTLQHFRVPPVLCINKADIYPEGVREIRRFAAAEGIPLLGELPFDEHIPQAMLQGAPVTQAYPESPAAAAARRIWEQLLGTLNDSED